MALNAPRNGERLRQLARVFNTTGTHVCTIADLKKLTGGLYKDQSNTLIYFDLDLLTRGGYLIHEAKGWRGTGMSLPKRYPAGLMKVLYNEAGQRRGNQGLLLAVLGNVVGTYLGLAVAQVLSGLGT